MHLQVSVLIKVSCTQLIFHVATNLSYISVPSQKTLLCALVIQANAERILSLAPYKRLYTKCNCFELISPTAVGMSADMRS